MAFHLRTVGAAAACFWLSAFPVEAQWQQCASGLDALRVAAEEAHEASDTVTTLEASLLAARDAYTRCMQDLDVFRIDRDTSPIPAAVQLDGCNQQVQSFRATERRHASGVDRASSVFRALAAAVQTVELSCQYPLAAYAPAQPPAESEEECRAPPASASSVAGPECRSSRCACSVPRRCPRRSARPVWARHATRTHSANRDGHFVFGGQHGRVRFSRLAVALST